MKTVSKKIKRRLVMLRIEDILDNFNYQKKVAVKLYGRISLMTEAQLRVLQCLVNYSYKHGGYEDLYQNIVVYSGPSAKYPTVPMCRNGYLEEPIEGFTDINGKLSKELL